MMCCEFSFNHSSFYTCSKISRANPGCPCTVTACHNCIILYDAHKHSHLLSVVCLCLTGKLGALGLWTGLACTASVQALLMSLTVFR